MSAKSYLLKISRPRFWIYLFGPFLIGAAAASDKLTEIATLNVGVLAVYFLFPANLLVYGVNDIFDYETDRLNPKKAKYETLVGPDFRFKLLLLIALLNIPFIVFTLFAGLRATSILAGFLFFSIFYSSPPIRAKSKPILDSMFNVLYVFPGLISYTLVSGRFPPWLIVLGAGLWTMAMHAFSAIPDIEPDRKSGTGTVATFLGQTGTLLFCALCFAGAALIGSLYIGLFAILMGSVYLLILIAAYFSRSAEGFFNIYRFFPILNAFFGFVIFWVIAYDKLV